MTTAIYIVRDTDTDAKIFAVDLVEICEFLIAEVSERDVYDAISLHHEYASLRETGCSELEFAENVAATVLRGLSVERVTK